MVCGNREQHRKHGEPVGSPGASINRKIAIGTGQEFYSGPQVQCTIMPGSTMNHCNETMTGDIGSHDIHKQRMQDQWEVHCEMQEQVKNLTLK